MDVVTRTVSPSFGDWQVALIDAGGLSLDGGSMFGSVPRGLWQRLIEPDSEHRIPLAMRLLVLRQKNDGRQVLVDTGIGNKFDEKFAARFAVEQPTQGVESLPIARALGTAGLNVNDITDLVLTHLHFDHGGGASHRGESGELTPTFARATHYLQEANLSTARTPNARERASYLCENVDPLSDVRLQLLNGSEEIMPGLSVIRSDGHTDGMQVVRLEGGGRVLYFLADLAPTHHHVSIPFTMGYDLSARDIMAEKSALWPRALEEEAILVFEHDTQMAAAQLAYENGRYQIGARIEFATD